MYIITREIERGRESTLTLEGLPGRSLTMVVGGCCCRCRAGSAQIRGEKNRPAVLSIAVAAARTLLLNQPWASSVLTDLGQASSKLGGKQMAKGHELTGLGLGEKWKNKMKIEMNGNERKER